jgi:polyisoprenoid-binding protein YceI
MFRFILIVGALLFLPRAMAEPVVYTPDKWHTRILFTVDHMGLSNYAGRFTEFDIQFLFDEEELENSSIEVTVPVSSIDTFSPELNGKMSSEMFFDSEEFPVMHFRSTLIEETGDGVGRMDGILTIKGKALPATFDFTINGKVMHEYYKLNNIGLSASAIVDSRAYGVNNLPQWMVGSDINVRIEMEAFEGDRVPYYSD